MQPIRSLSLIIALVLASFLTLTASGQYDDKENKEKKTGNSAPTKSTPAADTTPDPAIKDPLIRVLINKGILNNAEGVSLSSSASPDELRERLAGLLRDKGVITASEFEALKGNAPAIAQDRPQTSAAAAVAPSEPKKAAPTDEPKPAVTQEPIIAAVAPIRTLQVEPIKQGGLIPDVKLGSGGKLKFYGFLKTSIIHDSSSPLGNDFPLPGFLGDSGPDGSPEFHIKTRSLRLGANFEWPDAAPKTALTGRVEFDFEGSFTRSNNRNISTVRSSQPSIRLAYGRIDRLLTENTSAFALFGQDWTPFGSSTLPNLIEITGLGLGYGTLYERAPQARFGVNFKVPGNKSGLSFQPEFALVLPAFGNTPSTIDNQEGFGERQGADSDRPEMQGRFVTQWQLDKSRGVVPAQLIASWVWGKRKVIVPKLNVPAAYQAAFPFGVDQETDRWGYSLEAQLPTRLVTLLVKYYRGADLRFYFANQLFSTFNDPTGLTAPLSGASIDGSSSLIFGMLNGAATVAQQYPVRGQGGFVNLGIPISRIFNADATSRQAGWTAYLHYGIDSAFARDVRHMTIAAPVGNRGKGDLFAGTLYYKFNNWLTFGYEQSLYRTRAVDTVGVALPLYRGIPSREWHDLRSEFATIFTF
jgi:hypothetical protein